MTLKKIDELLKNAKKYALEKVKEDPREVEYANDWFTGYFMASLFRETFRSKNDKWGDKGSKAFNKWSKINYETINLKNEKNFSDIVKEFLNRR